jgi:hypothetical protein
MPLLGQLDLETIEQSVKSLTKEEIRLTRRSRVILAINGIATNIEEVPNLVQGPAITPDVRLRTIVYFAQGSLNVTQGVSL